MTSSGAPFYVSQAIQSVTRTDDGAGNPSRTEPCGARHKVLVVEADASLRIALRLTLVALGYETRGAVNGREAVALQRQSPADILITDLIVPEQDGMETIQEFRRDHPSVKIVAMSGGGWVNARDLLAIARKLGAHRTVAKPFSNRQLANVLTDLLPTHQK